MNTPFMPTAAPPVSDLNEIVVALSHQDLAAVRICRQRSRVLPEQYPEQIEQSLRARVEALDFANALELIQDRTRPVAQEGSDDHRHRILIVDDAPSTIHLLRSMLEGVGTLRFALTSRDAVSIIDAWRPDLVLCDVNLDERSGLDICRHIKRSATAHDPVVILISAANDIASEVAAPTAGADDFIEKPLHVARVMGRVHTQLARRARSGAAAAHEAGRILSEQLGFITCTPDGHIIDMSPKLRSLLGSIAPIPRAVHLGNCVLSPPLDELAHYIRLAASSGRLSPLDARLIGPHGDHIPARLTGWIAPGIEGRVLWISVEDLRRRVTAERRRLDTAVARAVTTMCAGIAHEYNNVLNVALGNLQISLDGLPPDSSLRPRLTTAQDAVERAISISIRVGRVAERESGNAQAEELDSLVMNMMPLLNALVLNHAELVHDASANTPFVRLDSNGLLSVLEHLVRNSCEAMPTGGRITIRTRAEQSENSVRTALIEVEDTGGGMADEVRVRAFDPFFTTSSPARAGLGLTEVRGYVLAQNGSIELLESRLGGTIVKMTFPAVD